MSITQTFTGAPPKNITTAKYGGDIDRLVMDFTKQTANKLAASAGKKGYNFESFTYHVDSGTSPSITFSFPVHGAYMDMKFLFWTKMPNISALENWVSKKYTGAFEVPGYQAGSQIGISQEQQNKRIAFAIARSKASGEMQNNWTKYRKAKVWQQPTVGKSVAYLAHLIAEELAAISSNALISPILTR